MVPVEFCSTINSMVGRTLIFHLIFVVSVSVITSTSSWATTGGFGGPLADSNCFFHGHAPWRDLEKHKNDPPPVRNRIRLRLKVADRFACRRWVEDYCKDSILNNERKVSNINGYFRTKSADGDSDHDVYDRFWVRSDCSVRNSTEAK